MPFFRLRKWHARYRLPSILSCIDQVEDRGDFTGESRQLQTSVVATEAQLEGVTEKDAELLAEPVGVVTVILPVAAPAGTVAVTCVSEFTVKVVAATPPKATRFVPVNPEPVITTRVPGGPLLGVKLDIKGRTRNLLLLVNVPEGVVTVTNPVVAPLGTVAIRKVLEATLKVAGAPLKETAVAPINP